MLSLDYFYYFCGGKSNNYQMGESFLYSIGHSNKTIDELVSELRLYGIQYLVDVRSMPYSKFYPQFNRELLKQTINQTGDIKYGYMGDVIGGLPQDEECYTDGKVDYRKIKQKLFFVEGIERLVKANEQGYKTCVMCSEGNPSMCHRSKLIGEAMREKGIIMQHICHDSHGRPILKSQIDVINEVNKGTSIVNLFGETVNLTSRKIYKEA